MIRVTTFDGKRVAVFGLGASGQAAARALAAGGATTAAWDDSAASRAAAEAAGIALTDLSTADWGSFAALVLAPGVPLTHPEPHWIVKRARRAGIEVIGDIELFFRERAQHAPAAKVIGITGTNGKSTTTALAAHLLRAAGLPVSMGGNIGAPVLLLEPLAAGRIYVIELSSFQIDLTPSLSCDAAALLNLTADHLDRHGTLADYAAVKARIFDRMPASGTAVVGVDDAFGEEISRRLSGRARSVVRVSVRPRDLDGLYACAETLCEREEGRVRTLASLAGIAALRGCHNWQNAAAAFALARAVGGDPARLAGAFGTFPGLPHRLEQVGRRGRALFINDSKATNADSAGKALACFAHDVFWIAGGRAKAGGIAGLAPHFPRVAKAYLIGQAMDEFAATLAGQVPVERCGTLERAIERAAADAALSPAAEPVVLLSPACASYDQFKSFEERGDRFRRLVGALPGVARTGPT